MVNDQVSQTNTLLKKANHEVASELHNSKKLHFSITINRTPEDVFAFWRNFKNFQFIAKDLSSIEILSSKLSRWTLNLKNDTEVVWISEIIAEQPGQMISWQSVGHSDVRQAGSVWFAKTPLGDGCIVRLHLAYAIPKRRIAEIPEELRHDDPNTLIIKAMLNLKSYLEASENFKNFEQTGGREKEFIPAEKH